MSTDKARKIILLGIDGLEPKIVRSLISDNEDGGFAAIASETEPVSLESVFPPDSVIAWPTIYTGLSPTKIYRKTPSMEYGAPLNDDMGIRNKLVGKTFWDHVGNHGIEVCIVNPFLAYPSWPVNGVMISSPFTKQGDVSVFPESVLEAYETKKSNIGGYASLPRERSNIYKKQVDVTRHLVRLSLRLLSDFDHDLFFVCFLSLDNIQHIFWRFAMNKETYSIDSYQGYIGALYRTFDKVVKTFIDKFGDEYTIVVFGDHGHGPRPPKLFSVNEFLRRQGFMNEKRTTSKGIAQNIMKIASLELAYYLRMDWLYKIYDYLKGISPEKFSIGSKSNLDSMQISSAWEFGMKQFGGIYVNENCGEEYGKVTNRILQLFNGLEIVEWICKTDEFYSDAKGSYPDIIFKLKDEYAVYHNLYAPLIMPNFASRIISGGHMPETLLMLWPGPQQISISNARRKHNIIDVAPSVLQHFNINIHPNLDGKAIWRSP